MNNIRRKEIDSAIKTVEVLELKMQELRAAFEAAKEDASDLKATIEQIKSDEEEYRDNMPENLQQSDRYQTADAACDQLQSACDKLEEFDSIEFNFDTDDIITALDEAKA